MLRRRDQKKRMKLRRRRHELLTTVNRELYMLNSVLKILSIISISILTSGCIIHDSGHGSGGHYDDAYYKSETQDGCLYDTECYQDEYCGEEGLCYPVRACSGHSQCQFNEICQDQICVSTESCTLDQECGTGRFCVDASCRLIGACQADLDCPTAMYCGFDQVCLTLPEGHCIVDEDCFSGAICSAGGYCGG